MLLFALAGIALAQEEPDFSPNINAQAYRVPVDADQTLWADDAGLVRDDMFYGRGRFAIGYMNRPLVYVDGNDELTTLVQDALQLNLIGAATIAHRFRIGADIPIYLLGTGAAFDGGKAGIGDISLDLRGTIIDREEYPVGVAIGSRIGLPSGSLAGLGGAGAAADFQAIVDRQFTDEFVAAVNLGTRVNPATELENIEWNDQFFWRLGGGYQITDAAGATVDFAGAVNYAGTGGLAGVPMEILLGGWGVPDADLPLKIRGGLGTGLSPGITSPTFRGVLLLEYQQPVNRDTDLDGIVDKEDHCIDDPEDKDDFEDLDGCPELDNDKDGIVDTEDECPLEPEDLDEYQDVDGCPDPSTMVKVKVTDPDGNQLGQALVEIMNDDERHVDTRGTFEHKFHPGSYKVIAEADGFNERAYDVEIPEVEVHDLLVVLEPKVKLGQLVFKVQNIEGEPVEATWQVDDNEEAIVPDEGTQITLTPGEHEIWVHAPGYAPSRMMVKIAANETANVLVMLQPSKAEITKEKIEIRETVYFNTNKASIKQESFGLLDEVASILIKHPEVTKIRIEGHTDKVGRESYNQDLSERRAASVKTYLIEAGVEEERLESIGYGESKPLVDEDTEEAYAKNRRVEFFIVERDGEEVEREEDLLESDEAKEEE